MELTKDAEKLLCMLYIKYLENRQDGVRKSQARSFGSSRIIHKTLCPDLLFEDVEDTCRELEHATLIYCLWADNHAQKVCLSDRGIVYMEYCFPNGLVEATRFIKLLP